MKEIIETTGAVLPERTPEVIAVEIRTIEENVYKTAVQGAIEIGRRLQEMKEALPHGEWYDFIEKNLGYSKRKAQNFMKIASEYGDENSPYYAAVAKTHTCAHLSISNALRLLTVTAEDVENIVEKVDISNATVKELEAEIQQLKKEKEQTRSELSAELQKQLRLENEKQAELNHRIEELEHELLDKSDNAEEIEKTRSQLNNMSEELQRAKERAEQLEKEMKNAEEREQIRLEEVKQQFRLEEQEKARKDVQEQLNLLESEKSRAVERARNAEKKLEASSDEAMIRIKIIADDLQDILKKANEALSEIEPEQAKKLRSALKNIIEAELK